MNYNLFSDKLEQHIKYRLEQSKVKLTDLVLEELISFALEDSGNKHIYDSGSHKKGSDIIINNNGFSIKSSKSKNGKISISSFRLTRFGDNLKEMTKFIDNDGKNFDKYLVLSRSDNKNKIKYTFYLLPSTIFSATKMKWVEKLNKKGSVSGWNTICNDNVNLKIVKSMSSQLWIEIKTEYIKDFILFEISKDILSLGEKRFVAK